MTPYEKTLNKLFRARTSSNGKLGLENVKKLSQLLLFPERSYPVIHIAGSNGKGSVATKIAKTLELAGYKVGLYTSPHLFSFRERIQIQGVCISEEEVASELENLFDLCFKAEINPTFFELATMLGFLHFQRHAVEVAVLETGLGGRLDATNIVQPILSIVTSISKEHTQLLGSTIEEIAQEKAGIFKTGVPVVLGPKAHLPILCQRANELGCPLTITASENVFFDDENQAIAKDALQILTKDFSVLSPHHIREGIRFRPACRFDKQKNFLFDVAHNPDAFEELFKGIKAFYPDHRVQVIMGLSDDKDKAACLTCAASHAKKLLLVQADSYRAASLKEMAEILQSLPYLHYSLENSIQEAVTKAADTIKSDLDLIVVCGSFYIMNEAKKAFDDLYPTDLVVGSPLVLSS